MSMDRPTLIGLLPCYVCGDLDEDVAAQVARAVAADADLQAMVTEIDRTRTACTDALQQRAPDAVAPTGPVGPGGPRPQVAWLGPVLGLAAAVLVAVLAPGVPAPDAAMSAAAAHQMAAATGAQLATGSRAEVHRALVAAGVPPMRAMVPDMSGLGMALVGAMRTPEGGPGVVVVYEKDGKRYTCQILEEFMTGATPVLWKQVGGTLVRVVDAGGQPMVAWSGAGMVCVFAGPAPAADLLAMVEKRLTPTG